MRKAFPWIEVGLGIGSLVVLASVTYGWSFADLQLFVLVPLLQLLRKLAATFGAWGISLEASIGSIRESTSLV